MKGLQFIILCSIFLIAAASSETNVIVNGDFESGAKEPWICNGCAGYVVHPGYNSDSSYVVESRKAVWSGPKQWLDVNTLSPDGRYNFGYSIKADAPVELKWKIKVTLSPDDIRYYTIDTFNVQAVGEWQEMESKIISLPPTTLEATEVEIYLEGDPGTTDFRMDDVYLTTREDPDNWEKEANDRIEKIRKSNVNITVLATSQYMKGSTNDLTLQVTQTSHKHVFGTALDCRTISDCLESGNDDEYCQFANDHYNMLVCGYRMKIKYVEEVQGEYNYKEGDNMVEWAKLHNMKARGHALLWAKEGNNPDWLKTMHGDEFVAAVYDRVDEATKRYSGYVEHWDVINEMVDQGSESHKFYIEHSGDENIRVQIFQRAKQMSPETLFFLNDYGIVDDRSGRFHLYQDQIRGLLEGGAPIDGIGLQSHFTGYEIDPYQIKDNADKLWNEFGIPMWVTEFTWSRGGIDDPNHEIHAKQLEDYYRLMFSLEYIDGFLMWHFSNGKDSNIVDTDTFETNLAGDTYLRLYHEEWRTNEVLEDQGTDNEDELATFRFRGFNGDYEIKLLDGENELKSWTRNLDENTPEWNLPMDEIL